MASTPDTTPRERAKADRSAALLREAARLFAAKGFDGVSLEDLGSAVGITGPAVYRHFRSKQALLGALLQRTSERLLDGGRAVVDAHETATDQLRALVAFHVDFAVDESDVIRAQDRGLGRLEQDDRREVRRLQREYIDLWIDVLSHLHPGASRDRLRVQAHAGFGLINSTPHSLRALRTAHDDGEVREILAAAAYAALTAGH